MKKNYFYSLFAALMLFVAMPATAQNFTIDQLYGKWEFTADIEWSANATDAQKEQVSNKCDVVISADETYLAKIVGFAGSANQQNVNMIGAKEGVDMIKINNPNNPALFNDIHLADLEGHNPYGYQVEEKDADGNPSIKWKTYGPIYYTVDAVNGLITIPDFTIVTLTGYEDTNPVVIATVTNAKMTLVEAAGPVAVEDISGEYVFKAAGSVMSDSEIPTEFAVKIVSKSEDYRTYEATIAIEGYDNVTLPATYDGTILSLAFNNSYIKSDNEVIENSIRFADYYSGIKEGTVQFTRKEQGFSLSYGICFVSDGKNDKDEDVVIYRQWYADGIMKLPSDAPEFDWAGVYTVKVDSEDIEEEVKVDMAWPAEFQMEISAWGEDYCITKFMGFDLSNYQGGLFIDILADGTGATIDLTQYYAMAPIKSNGDGTYWVLTDKKGAATELKLALNADGTLAIDDFSISNHSYGTEDFEDIVYYNNVAIEKNVAPVFNWAGTYKLEAKNVTNDYPNPIEVTVTYREDWGMYLVTHFNGNDITLLNSGGLEVVVAEDGNSASLVLTDYTGAAAGYLQTVVAGQSYLKLRAADGSASPIALTLENGVVKMADFAIVAGAYGSENANQTAAEYKEVTLKKVLGAPVLVHPDTSKEINSLNTFKFNFGEKVNVDLEYPGGLSLMKGEDKVAEFNMSWTEVYPDGNVVFYCSNVTTPGTYTLELPAGLVTAADGKEFVGAKYEFTVVAKAPSYSINPNGSADVNSIEKITIKCENVAEIAVDDTKQVWLTCGVTEYAGVVVKSENNIEITFKLDGEEVAKIEEEGEYVLTLPEGLFTMKGLDDSEVEYEGEELTFNVVAPSAVAPLEIANVTPTENEVGELTEIAIVYNQDVYFGNADWMSYAIYLTAENGDKIAMWARYGAAANTVALVPVALNEEGSPVCDEYGNPNIVAIPAGKYTLNVADITVRYGAEQYMDEWGWTNTRWNGFGYCEGEYTWTVTGADTAIDGVEAEVENDVIYDLTGRRVNEITKAGIYIVNGKKVLVK